MKSLLVILACLFLTANCGIYYMVQDEVPGHENQCYDEIDSQFYGPRQQMNSEPGMCSRVTCLGSRKDHKVLIEKATCGTFNAYPGCQVIEDLSKPYPECCPRIVHCSEEAANYTA